MSQTDIIVCGVATDEVIEDISFSVPRKVAVRIPGSIAFQSRDLWTKISQGLIFQCDVSNILPNKAPPKATSESQVDTANERKELILAQEKWNQERRALREKILALDTEIARLQVENTKLLDEKVRLQAELDNERGKASKLDKLDDILTLLKKAPTVVLGSTPVGLTSPNLVDDSAPKFIPSKIKTDVVVEGVPLTQESKSDAGSLASASKALRDRRKIQ